MTKKERLQDLKEQDRFYKVIDRYFDEGWKNWVRGIQHQNDISNVRLFKILSRIKGNDFVADLIRLMGKKNKSALLQLTNNPKGVLLKDNRFETIPEIMIDKYPSSSYREGKIFIQVNDSRWVSFVF